jgi:hypothetical protein
MRMLTCLGGPYECGRVVRIVNAPSLEVVASPRQEMSRSAEGVCSGGLEAPLARGACYYSDFVGTVIILVSELSDFVRNE